MYWTKSEAINQLLVFKKVIDIFWKSLLPTVTLKTFSQASVVISSQANLTVPFWTLFLDFVFP